MNILYQQIKSVLGLSFSLAKANFKVRNEGSFLGIFWYLLEPLTFFVVLYLMSETLAQSAVVNYPIYLFIGLIIFNFFNAVTTFSTKVIASNAGFIKSLKIQSEAFVISGVLQFIFSHIFELIALIILALIFKVNILGLIFYPIIFIFFALFTTGISFLLAVWGVHIGDLRNVWVVFTRLLWFATPIFYLANPTSAIAQINLWNPLYYFINATRNLLINHALPSASNFWLMTLLGLGSFAIGLGVFEKFKGRLAEKL